MNQKQGRSSWVKNLFEGFLMLAIAGFLFWYFSDFEASHEPSRRIHWVVAWLYNMGGKWLVCSLVVAMAVIEFVAAGRKFMLRS